MAAMLLITVSGAVMIIRRAALFLKSKVSAVEAYIISTIAVTAVLLTLYFTMGVWNMMIVFVHLVVMMLLSDFLFFIFARILKKKKSKKISGAVALILTVAYLGVGMFFAYHVFRTEYTVKVSSDTDDFRIVGFSDSHVGATFHGEDFREYVEMMNKEDADIAVIVGDFVDDDTSYEDMVRSCEELANLKTKYGTYFVFGNHDCGYYGREYRGYGEKELVENLEKNGITVLYDETVHITGNVYLCGRLDAQMKDRKAMDKLSEKFSDDNCVIVLDHEPTDYENEAGAVDLVLSGHTHGGQFIPINRIGEVFNINDMTYGKKTEDGTNFIVSSGIADWAFKFKTGCISEYFVVNIKS